MGSWIQCGSLAAAPYSTAGDARLRQQESQALPCDNCTRIRVHYKNRSFWRFVDKCYRPV